MAGRILKIIIICVLLSPSFVSAAMVTSSGIARDRSTQTNVTGTAASVNITTSGNNRILFYGFQNNTDANDVVTSVTYGGVAMTLLHKYKLGNNAQYAYLYTLVNPALGTNALVINSSASKNYLGWAFSYTGVDQINYLDATNYVDGQTGTTLTNTIQKVKKNTWIILYVTNADNIYTSSTNATVFGTLNSYNAFDDKGKGYLNQSVTQTVVRASGTRTLYWAQISLAPASKVAKTITNSAGVAKDKLLDGLVDWWTFDGPTVSETQVLDSGTGDNPGTLVAGGSLVSGKIGQGFGPKGVGNLNINNSATTLRAMTVGSFSLWFKSKADSGKAVFSIGQAGTDDVTMYLGDVTGGYADESIYFQNNDNGVAFRIRWVVRKGHDFYRDDKWHHFVYTMGAASNSVYVDGVQQSLSYLDGSTATGNVFMKGDDETVASIGKAGAVTTSIFNGLLDDVRIYSRVLSTDEVKSLYQYGNAKVVTSSAAVSAQGTKNGLVGWWTFDGADMTATAAFDKSGTGNTGTLTGTKKVSGKTGQGLQGATIGDYVDVGAMGTYCNDVFNGTTMAFWIKTTNTAASFPAGTVGANSNDNFQVILPSFNRNSAYTTATGNINFTMQKRVTLGKQLTAGVDYDTGITDGKWHHVTFVGIPASDTVHIYVDGVSQTITYNLQQLSALGDNWINCLVSMRLVGANNNGTAIAFPGSMDDVRIYNRALSANEVYSLYQYGK